MEIRDLHYFQVCLQAGSLTRAAEHLHVGQSTLSHALRRLEQEAGTPLVDRSAGRGTLAATEAGQLLLQRSARIAEEIDGFHHDLASLGDQIRGQVTLVAPQSLAQSFLPPILVEFAAAHPLVSVELRTVSTTDIPDAVREGRGALGLAAGLPPGADAGLNVHECFEEEFIIIMRRDDPLAATKPLPLAALAQRRLALVPANTHTGLTILSACRQAGFEPRPALWLESGPALLAAVRKGLGLTILPRCYLPAEASDLLAVPIAAPTPRRRIVVLTPARRTLYRAAAALQTSILEHSPAD